MKQHHFGAMFHARQKELGMPVTEVARRMGVTVTRVRQMFAAQKLREDTIHALSRVLYLDLVPSPQPVEARVASSPRELTVAPWYDAPSAPDTF